MYNYLPMKRWRNDSSFSNWYWTGPKNYNQPLFCPSTQIRGDEYGATNNKNTAIFCSYGGNRYLQHAVVATLHKIKKPSQIIMFLDGRISAGAGGPIQTFRTGLMSNTTYQNWRHNNFVNAVFVDGHVTRLSLQDCNTTEMFEEQE
jgi:prepilin-type processing-associated H-X9-DG protein